MSFYGIRGSRESGPVEERSEKTIVETPVGNALCRIKRQGAVSGWSNNPTS